MSALPPQIDDAEPKQQQSLAATTESDKDSTAALSKGKAANGGKEKITKKMLKEAEQELFQLLLRKKQLDRNLIEAETAIYDFETSYFENSGHEGNIVHGFDGYLGGRGDRRQMHFTEGDRIFSQSSATFKRAQEAKIAALLDSDSEDSDDGKAAAATRKMGGSTIRHGGQRAGTPVRERAGTPARERAGTPIGGSGVRGTKKIRLSVDSGN
ncbi:chromatin modification- protein eaf6 [Coemansia sp. RSA 2050]|nr:chromatin modification- protein eaf6 [Coemansia sp. RSA 2050]KAJ2730942.1 chromatin modification- protein eaf6 [Coemansia sp. BCRC 34962]